MHSFRKIRTILTGLIFCLLFQSTYALGALDWTQDTESGQETIAICTEEGARTITLHQSNPVEQHSSHCHCQCASCGTLFTVAPAPEELKITFALLGQKSFTDYTNGTYLPNTHPPRPPAQAPPNFS
jgi:hypothetical protein